MSRQELRAMARKQLDGKIFANKWLMLLVVFLLSSAIMGVAGVVVIGTLLVYGPLCYGICRVTTKNARGGDAIDVMDLFVAVKEDIGNTIVLGLLETIFIFLWSLLFVIPGIVKAYAYSMAFYIQQDQSNKDWKYCLDESQKRMRGLKWKLFVLDLSFIGWYILGMLCFGVGVLFVQPYHEQTRANFYEQFVKQEVPSAESEVTPAV